MSTFLLLAQATDPVSGAVAGWSSFGIAGLVLAWLLLKHLPEKDKQINDLIRSHDEQMTAMVDKKDKQIDQQRAEFTITLNQLASAFRSESAAERQACEKHFETLSTSMTTAFRTLGDQLANQAREAAAHSERNRQWLDTLKKEIEERKAALARREDRP